jgi:hypothetical protein
MLLIKAGREAFLSYIISISLPLTVDAYTEPSMSVCDDDDDDDDVDDNCESSKFDGEGGTGEVSI